METTEHKATDRNGIIATLAEMPGEAIVDEAGLARIFHRHPVSIKRAIRRGNCPPASACSASRPGPRKPCWTT